MTNLAGIHSIEGSQTRIAERLTVLRDTFSESDHRVKMVEDRIEEIVNDGTEFSWQIASSYVAWATKYPEDIAHEPTYDCTCGIGKGWVREIDETGKLTEVRPCSRCNEKLFHFLYEAGGLKVTPGGSYEEPPTQEPPAWDDL